MSIVDNANSFTARCINGVSMTSFKRDVRLRLVKATPARA